MPKKIILFLIILVTATALAGGIYKWIDQKGVTNYAPTPPPDTKADSALNFPPGATTSPQP
jgi:Domain of unknown function (DUF4124)